jgi:hypothetical protein
MPIVIVGNFNYNASSMINFDSYSGTKETTNNAVIIKMDKFKMSSYCLTGPSLLLFISKDRLQNKVSVLTRSGF